MSRYVRFSNRPFEVKRFQAIHHDSMALLREGKNMTDDDRRAALEFAREAFHKANEAASSAANLALRMSLLINGGAAVALLAFIKDLSEEQQHAVADTLVWFGFGVIAAVIALALAYFTNYSLGGVEISKMPTDQHPYFRDGPTTARWKRRYWVFLWASIIVGFGSVGLFVIGLLLVRKALLA